MALRQVAPLCMVLGRSSGQRHGPEFWDNRDPRSCPPPRYYRAAFAAFRRFRALVADDSFWRPMQARQRDASGSPIAIVILSVRLSVRLSVCL